MMIMMMIMMVIMKMKMMLQGEWNGAGAHTNFSTGKMREENGIIEIEVIFMMMIILMKDNFCLNKIMTNTFRRHKIYPV